MPIKQHAPLPNESAFRSWLEDRGVQPSYVADVISNCRRVLARDGKLPTDKDAIPTTVKRLKFPSFYVDRSITNALRRYVEFLAGAET